MNRDEGVVAAVTRLHAGIPVGPGLYGDLAVPPDAIGVTSSPTAAARAASARATAGSPTSSIGVESRPCSSTCSPRPRSRTARTSSTSSCWAAAGGDDPLAAEQPPAEGLAPASSAPAPAPRRPLRAAAALGATVRAVVARGGRPDLAGARLARVDSPTLLVVGDDDVVIGLNRDALRARL